MKLFTRIALLCTTALLPYSAFAGDTKYYSKSQATASPSGAGKVYAAPYDQVVPQYGETSLSDIKTTEDKNQIHYLYAEANEGYQFKNWTLADGTVKSANEYYQVSITSSSTKENSPTIVSYVANFVERTTALIVVPDVTTASATVSPKSNKIGQEVTVTFSPLINLTGVPNPHLVFNGCYDQDGNLVSTEESFKIKPDKFMTLRGSYSLAPPTVKSNRCYYRVMSHFNSPLRISGNRSITIGSSAISLHPDITMVRNPLGQQLGRGDGAQAILNRNFYDDPATVILIEGDLQQANYNNYKDGDLVLDNVSLYAQGMYATDPKILNFKATAQLCWGYRWGHYKLVSSSAAMKSLYDSNVNTYSDVVKVGDDNAYDLMTSYSVQPITEEYADSYWFGACPTEEMYHDGGYWTSMYASFPFMCYEPDGVEAYIISDCKNDGEENLLVLSRIENGIVPAATPVLLKCRDWTDTSDYFNNKKPLAPQNRLIPLLPDDERIDPNVAAGNLLSGTYNLLNGSVSVDWSNVESLVPDKYDDSRHRIFSVNAAGQVGFYRQASNYKYWVENTNEVTASSLCPNRAYLDMANLPSATLQGAPFRIISENEAAGIENIVIDENPAARHGIFDLYGRRVERMVPGNIYIVNGVKTLAR